MRSQSDRNEAMGQAGARSVRARLQRWPSGTQRRHVAALLAAGILSILSAGCPTVASPGAARPQTADKWFRRAQTEFQIADVEEARDSVGKALTIVPDDPEVRALAARIALARLDYDETLRLLKGMPSSEASGLRGRALWYKGDLESAADELEAMLNDPDVKDEWAKPITKLARRGIGRTPFKLSGAMLAAVDLPHVSQTDRLVVVPLEIDGESALAMVSTAVPELVLDSTTRPEPSWVSIRFDKRFEVHDVPALSQDLSAVSKQIGAPIKAIIGVNLLRHMNATMDYDGHQFVVRNFSPPPPPDAIRVAVYYVRGGGMVLKTAFGGDGSSRASVLVDTSSPFPIALDSAGWKKAGIDATSLKLIPHDPEQKREGVVPVVRLGATPVNKVPGVHGLSTINQIEKMLAVDIDGILGAPLLSAFRITFGDGGRLMWLEDSASLLRLLQGSSKSLGLPSPAPGSSVLPGIAPEPLVGPLPAPQGTKPVAPSKTPPAPQGTKPVAPSNTPPPPKDKKPDGGARPSKAPPGP